MKFLKACYNIFYEFQSTIKIKENLPMQKGYIGGMALKQSKNKETKKTEKCKTKKEWYETF